MIIKFGICVIGILGRDSVIDKIVSIWNEIAQLCRWLGVHSETCRDKETANMKKLYLADCVFGL